MSDLLAQFNEYRKTVSLTRIRMADVPEEMRPLVKVYRDRLMSQLNDPENDSWDDLGPNEHYNALLAVVRACRPVSTKPQGNCPRCGGLGQILAYGHIHGGVCFRCEGTGNI